MRIEWNDEIQEAVSILCRLAHDNRVDITITFTEDEGESEAELKVEPTYWDKDKPQIKLNVEEGVREMKNNLQRVVEQAKRREKSDD